MIATRLRKLLELFTGFRAPAPGTTDAVNAPVDKSEASTVPDLARTKRAQLKSALDSKPRMPPPVPRRRQP